MQTSMTRVIAAVAAGFAVAVVLASLFVSGVRAADVAAKQAAAQLAIAKSAYMYVDFRDDFQHPRQTALGWRGARAAGPGAAWRVSRRPGGAPAGTREAGPACFMRYRDSGAGTLTAAHGRALLAYNFTMYVDLRATDVAAEAGLTWGVGKDVSWRATIAGNWLRLVRAQAGGEREAARAALPLPRKEVWRLGVVSGQGRFAVTLGDRYVLQAPWTQGNNPGGFGLWSRGAGEFENFVLEARPAEPGIIALAKLDADNNMNICVGPADGGEGAFFSHKRGANYYPTWSPDGKRIAFQSDAGEGNKQGIFLAGGAPDKTTGKAPADKALAEGPYAHPAWSPTSDIIAFDAVTSPAAKSETHDVMVMNADGSGIKNITDNPADDVSPAWSPDGRKIAFCSDRDGGFDIFVAAADGSDPVNITKTPGVLETDPAWSPDGQRIAFCAAEGGAPPASADARSALYVMNANGGERTCIYRSPAADAYTPAWSPDGEKIAFSEYRGDNYVIVMNADGSNVFPAFATKPSATPAWRPAQPQPEPQIAVASASASPGATVSVPILIQGMKGVRSATVEVAWDSAAATLKRAAAGDTTAGKEWSFDAKTGSGTATLKLTSGAPAWRDSGALAELEFDVPASVKVGTDIAVEIRSIAVEIAGGAPPAGVKAQPTLWQGGIQVVAASD